MPMSEVLPVYSFPSLLWWQTLKQNENCLLEVHENWVKQSFRNRFEIAGPNGRQSLSIPTIKKSRIKLKDVRISYAEDWVKNHIRSVKTAYNSSPYYAYYAHEFDNLLTSKPTFLIDLNIRAIEVGINRLEVNHKMNQTNQFVESVEMNLKTMHTPKYNQVFEEKNGFIPNLSFIDLLFNCGPESGVVLS
jgi:hypothetical protein